jgi:hypothetical protein
MDTTEKLNSAEKEAFLLVVEELAQEQAKNNKTVSDLTAAVNVLTGKVDEVKEKVDKPKPVIVSADTRPMQEIVRKGVAEMKIMVGTKPQSIVKKFQILLFPEQDAKLFYKIVFGRWFLFLVLMLLIVNLYNFSVHWSDNQKEVQRSQLENERINRAWYYLYDQAGKAGKRQMDSAYAKSWKNE